MMILEPLAILAAVIGINYLEGCLKTWSGKSGRRVQKINKHPETAYGKYGYV
ncbi:MAG: hypothetical protein LKM41_12530 [Lachnospiraceae bacterium]|nr:hypothetical protein [Lachnospiraceae bacterium]